jgi:hypothetical protein
MVVVAAVLLGVCSRLRGERATERGREAAAEWLPLQGSGPRVGPAAVAEHGHDLAYAAVLGLAARAAHAVHPRQAAGGRRITSDAGQ